MKLRVSLLYWAAAAAIVAAVVSVYFRGGTPQAAGPEGLVGRPAPSFDVPKLGGGVAGLESYRGKIVVLNLWGTWCPPCRAEMPDLQRLYRQYQSRNVVVVGVDQGESQTRAGEFAAALGITYPILIDEQQQYGRVYAALGMPTTIVVNPAGTVARAFDGPLTFGQMTAAITPLLRGTT
ncbi:MAG TPA: TlpA disulfide reductase family protein [Candidatus Baltobacteraceae bacterium]|nr:TlpA disulfide reductase family protein [Candidatus Baltobacteraceae bacterium]